MQIIAASEKHAKKYNILPNVADFLIEFLELKSNLKFIIIFEKYIRKRGIPITPKLYSIVKYGISEVLINGLVEYNSKDSSFSESALPPKEVSNRKLEL